MKNKIFSLFAISVFVFVVLMSGVSGASILGSSVIVFQPTNISHDAGSFTVSFNLTNSGADDASPITWSSSLTSGTATITLPTDTTLDNVITKTFSATVSFPEHQSGTLAWTITANPNGLGSDEIISFSVPILSSSELLVSSATMTQTSNSSTITVTNDGNVALTNVALTSTGDFNVSLSSPTIASLAAGANSTITVTRTTALSSLAIGTNTVALNATSGTTTAAGTLTLEKSFCELGPVNDTKLDFNVDIKNNGQGEDDNWLPLDEIEVEVELKNDLGQDADGDDIDLSDITFVLGLFKKGTSSDVAADMIWLSDNEDEFEFGDINEGDDGKHVFSFKVDPAQIDGGDYYLVVKAFPSGDEDQYCVDYSSDLTSFGSKNYYAEIKVDGESDKDKMVVIDETSFPAITEVACGEQASLTADVWNIGSTDFADQFMVTLSNKDLGVDLRAEVPEDLDAGDNAEVSFPFNIPSDAEEKTYTLEMRTYYDYDAEQGTYETDYDKRSDDTFNAFYKVAGNCLVSQPASVDKTKVIVEGGKAGQDLVIKIPVKNTGTKTADYVVNPTKYSEWASSAKVDTQTFTLAAGESKEVAITLDVKPSASGEKNFDVEISSGDKLVSTQPVSVEIEPGFSLAGITGNVISGDKGYLWGFVALNVILIVAIILVVVRFMRK